jgi:hypothetical protein
MHPKIPAPKLLEVQPRSGRWWLRLITSCSCTASTAGYALRSP